ncbi:hypothetical protein [Janthinobacterium lividum]|uniref:hypothetical protein n=1 Tax=Janthinobacterium lividum TaxID=29581 RepID=UPI000448B9F5|nr:hypothetical protein [Janthinobacterium lividum]EZP41385.1 hypothetical protein BW37_00157 [Janthinobacterium lividum]
MLSVAKLFIAALLILCSNFTNAHDMYIFVVQETPFAMCEGKSFDEVDGIYEIDEGGREIPAGTNSSQDTCRNMGSIIPLGQEILKAGMAKRVVFMLTNVARSDEILIDDEESKKLNSAIELANSKKIKFDFALWQGNLMGKNPNSSYSREVQAAVKSISLSAKVEKWVIGLSAYCHRPAGDPAISIRQEPLINRFPGPDIGVLAGEYRTDQCSVNDLGQKEMAKLWYAAMKKADIESEKYQKESLLYYFK